MGTNIKITLVVAIILATTISSTCKKNLICGDKASYFFTNNHATAYPTRDSIRVGDTLVVEISMPTTLRDTLTNSLIDFSDAIGIGNSFSMDIFTGGSVSNPGSSFAANNFEYYVFNGQSINSSFPERIRNYTFNKVASTFILKVGIIAKSIGIYALAISDAPLVSRKGDNCTRASFTFLFGNTNQHLYFYQNNRPGYVISDYERQHMYCFKVY